MNPVYLSTGAFTGRVNGRNWRFAIEYAERLDCDGYELLIFPEFEEKIDEIVREYRAAGLRIPVVHAEKHIGDLMSSPGADAMAEAMELARRNFETAAALYRTGVSPEGHAKVVVHCWGIPDSDTYFGEIAERVGRLSELAERCGVEMLPENSFCVHGSPKAHFEALAARYPKQGFIVDTRCAAFHAELPELVRSEVFRTRVRHIHINDYSGGYRDWDAMYPILQPGRGNIDWNAFFEGLRAIPYAHSVTLEAPSMRPDGVDCATLNESLGRIRRALRGEPF
ncbi:MAG: sugar phosphate isomerase/epimerase [Eubacteriales bacterium]|nr:sugar phosphate isomerase/epimerase [Eubacteriales bacterium]